jgi:hypothetical protein
MMEICEYTEMENIKAAIEIPKATQTLVGVLSPDNQFTGSDVSNLI